MSALLVCSATAIAFGATPIPLAKFSRPIAVGALIAVIGLSFLRLWADGVDSRGGLAFAPVRGGSDQIDYTLMSYTFAKYSFPGTTGGSEAAKPIIEWANEHGVEGPLLERWRGIAERPDEPRSYIYRPHAYSILVGSIFKLVGYQPELMPVINAVLYAITSGLLFYMASRWWSAQAGVFAVAGFLSVDVIRTWALQSMPEMFSVMLHTILILAIAEACEATCRPIRRRWSFVAGITLALLIQTKQLYLIAGVFAIIILSLAAKVMRRSSLAAGPFALAAVLILGPSLGYNVGSSSSALLLTGSNGWHDMPWAYSQDFLEGENRYVIRERMFDEYALETGTKVSGDVQRALAGREMFMERFSEGEYWGRLAPLAWKKLSEAARGSASIPNQAMRVSALLLLILAAFSRRNRKRHLSHSSSKIRLVVLGAFGATPFIATAITNSDAGRHVQGTWVPVVLLFAAASGWQWGVTWGQRLRRPTRC